MFCSAVRNTRKGRLATQGKPISSNEARAVLGSPTQLCASEPRPIALSPWLSMPSFGSKTNDHTSTVTTPGKASGAISRVRKTNWSRSLRRLITSSAASSGSTHMTVTLTTKM